MLTPDNVVLCRYQYDPMGRIAGCSPAGADSVRQFYQKSHLATEIQGQSRRALFQADDQLLAQQVSENTSSSTALLATDQQRSVLHQVTGNQQTSRAYTVYGFSPAHLNLPGFNGAQRDTITGHYLLGNGYRAFNPVLMRFNSADSLSPFGEGGLNAYAYCVGDPVNRVDPTGHMNVRMHVAIFKASKLPRLPYKQTARTRHPITSTSNPTVEVGMIQGNIGTVANQRVNELKASYKITSLADVRNLKKAEMRAYLHQLKVVSAFSEREQVVLSIQMRPLPPSPRGQRPNPQPQARPNDHKYDLVRPHLPRQLQGGVSGILPREKQMQTIPEEASEIRKI